MSVPPAVIPAWIRLELTTPPDWEEFDRLCKEYYAKAYQDKELNHEVL